MNGDPGQSQPTPAPEPPDTEEDGGLGHHPAEEAEEELFEELDDEDLDEEDFDEEEDDEFDDLEP